MKKIILSSLLAFASIITSYGYTREVRVDASAFNNGGCDHYSNSYTFYSSSFIVCGVLYTQSFESAGPYHYASVNGETNAYVLRDASGFTNSGSIGVPNSTGEGNITITVHGQCRGVAGAFFISHAYAKLVW